MKSFSIIALLPLAFALSPIPRQNIPTPSNCAIGCLADITLNPAPCGGTDFVCFCTNTEIKGRVISCLTANCAGDQLQAANDLYASTCTDAGASNPLSSRAAASASASSAAPAPSASAVSVTADRVGPINTSRMSAGEGPSSTAASAVSAASSAVSASRSSVAASASSSSGAQPTGLVKGLVAVGLGAAGVLGMM